MKKSYTILKSDLKTLKKYYFKFGVVSGIHCYTLRKFIKTFSLFHNNKVISGYGYN